VLLAAEQHNRGASLIQTVRLGQQRPSHQHEWNCVGNPLGKKPPWTPPRPPHHGQHSIVPALQSLAVAADSATVILTTCQERECIARVHKLLHLPWPCARAKEHHVSSASLQLGQGQRSPVLFSLAVNSALLSSRVTPALSQSPSNSAAPTAPPSPLLLLLLVVVSSRQNRPCIQCSFNKLRTK